VSKCEVSKCIIESHRIKSSRRYIYRERVREETSEREKE
jgi:hypothetical protein